MALASFGESSLVSVTLTLADSYSGSAASIQFQKEQQRSPSGLQEANVTWHFLAFYLSGT